MNNAQKVLMMIGGTAELVAGFNGHYYADQQTPEKTRRSGAGKGHYGKDCMAHFARVRKTRKDAKQSRK